MVEDSILQALPAGPSPALTKIARVSVHHREGMGASRSRLGPPGHEPHVERTRSRAVRTFDRASSQRLSACEVRSHKCPVARSMEPSARQAAAQSPAAPASSRSARSSSVRARLLDVSMVFGALAPLLGSEASTVPSLAGLAGAASRSGDFAFGGASPPQAARSAPRTMCENIRRLAITSSPRASLRPEMRAKY